MAALVVGLLAGFAGGFFIGQSREPISAPPVAAKAVLAEPPAETYTDTAIVEAVPEPPQEAAPQVMPSAPQVMRGAPSRAAEHTVLVATPVSGSVLVASRPSGARVFVDGRRVGVTPLSVPGMKAGSHSVRLELPGFRPWATSVHVDNGARTRVGASLDR